MAMAAFLEQAAIGGMHGLQLRKRCQRRVRLLQIALAYRDHVEHIAVFGHLAQQGFAGGQRLGKAGCLHQRADAKNLRLDR